MLTAARSSSVRTRDAQEDLDHLFLLPERVLGMDSTQLHQDLAGLDFSAHLLHSGPSGNVWLSGAAAVDGNNQGRPSSAPSSRLSTHRGHSGTLHWFANIGKEADSLENGFVSPELNSLLPETQTGGDGRAPPSDPGKDGTNLSQKEREERLRALRERQQEERQKKLEELKQQALAAQKFREQKEEERRQRIDELRRRDDERRHQVEERKRQIWEAERERREAIVRKNQERETRHDTKRRNEKSSIVFAFGSSTPRMLEPADTGGSFWGTRRATSTTNVMLMSAMPLTRRSSERELDGSKKRATSAGGLDRKPGEDMRMSTSMYEVFNWNPDSDPEPSSRHRSRSARREYTLPLNETTVEVSTNPDVNIDGRSRNVSSAPQTPSPRNISCIFGGSVVSDETDVASVPGATAVTRVNRRKTDLMPTIPSYRDSSSRPPSASRPFGRSPGRAFSMSRLDQLAQPRRRPELTVLPEQQPRLGTSPSSVSRSMSHLAGTGSKKVLRRSEATRSMSHLAQPHPIPPPRLTRAEKLRQKAREAATKPQQPQGLRSGEVTPSRPQSAMSQSSSVGSNVSLRPRPVTAPRRQRPASIAVTGVSADAEPRASRRNSNTGESRVSKTGSTTAIADKEKEGAAKPPVPKVHITKKPTHPRPEVPARKNSDKTVKAAKASPKVTPQITPLASPGCEAPPTLVDNDIVKKDIEDVPVQPPQKIESSDKVVKQETVKQTETIETVVNEVSESEEKPSSTQQIPDPVVPETLPQPAEETPTQMPVEKTETTKSSDSLDQESDMTASMIAKARITTEEEAKAALAERRRLAREQAEREAELERQRLEEERRKEEERLRLEEEEQRRFEEEQLRLVEAARRAEEERLLQAIQEKEKREEEERKRREEEARARAEREEAERKAKEEAERLRREMDEKLKKEEEERIMRRKRVEAIMSRTRQSKGGNSGNTSKNEEDGDTPKDESPSEESKEHSQLNTNSMSASFRDHIKENGSGEVNKVTSNSELLLIDSGVKGNNGLMETGEDTTTTTTTTSHPLQSNGHRNGVLDLVGIDNVKQNNATNNLLDFSEFDTFGSSNVTYQQKSTTGGMDFLDSTVTMHTPGKMANEDNVNSNVINNTPLIAFDDNVAKKQDTNSVADLLS